MAELIKDKNAPRKKTRVGRILMLVAVLAIVVFGGIYLWKYLNTYETTDDAQIDGHINAVSARITGNVIEVLAEDEQMRQSRRRAGPDRSAATTRSRSPRRKRIWPTPKRRSKVRASIFPSPPPTRPAS